MNILVALNKGDMTQNSPADEYFSSQTEGYSTQISLADEYFGCLKPRVTVHKLVPQINILDHSTQNRPADEYVSCLNRG